MARARMASVAFVLLLARVGYAKRVSALRTLSTSKATLGANGEEVWTACAMEGEAIAGPGLVRFGLNLAWVEASLPAGATCSLESFASDPAPGIRKVCECIPDSQDGASKREELGVEWERCGAEGQFCNCASGNIRFGVASRWVVTELGKPVEDHPCTTQSFSDKDPAPQVTKECWCEVKRQGTVPNVRAAIVLDSRRPPDLTTWLQYHLEYMKVDHVFMQVEDTPDFTKQFAALDPAIQQRVSVWTPTKTLAQQDARPRDDYDDLQRRQLALMKRAKAECKVRGIEWLIHVDDDELLYTPLHRTIGDVLGSMPQFFDQALIPNVEAVYTGPQVKNCFTETTEANVNPFAFVSYANGKSAVRVSNVDAIPAGPHHWRTAFGELSSVHLDKEPFGPPVMVLHYESCPFNRWEQKYWELGHTSKQKVNSIPFPFYRDSITRMMRCSRDISDGVVNANAAGECSEQAMEQLWASFKTAKNPRIRKQDLMAISLPWDKVMAIHPA